jgi:hypothetical protein
LLGGTLAASPAAAYCRTVAASVPPNYDPVVQGCFGPASGAGSYELYWKNLCVGYSLQQDASPMRGITLTQATAVAGQAFSTWSAAPCTAGGMPSIQFFDEGPVECGAVNYNKDAANQHVIVFRDSGWPYDDSSNTLGLTTLTYDLTDGEIFDADMELNSHDYNLVLASPAPVDSYDLASVITHEAGHFLGLAHSTDNTAVMYAHYHAGEGTLTQDDIDGVCSIYPSGGLRVTSAGPLAGDACDPTARHGFASECMPAASSGATSTSSHKCSVSGGPGAGGGALGFGGFAGLGLFAGAWLMRRRVRRQAALRRGALAVFLALAGVGASALVASDAQASVSVAVLFEELVANSSGVAAVTPIEQHAAWENGRIYTYTRVRVDTLVAGDLPREVSVRTLGGEVGQIGQHVEGEPTFAVGDPVLLFLHRRADGLEALEVTARAQGEFSLVAGEGKGLRLAAATGTGALFPPTPERVARVVALNPGGGTPRFARDVLHGRALQDGTRDIVAAWARLHKK